MAGLTTERLVLRQWRESDRAPVAALNADPSVMEHFPATLNRAESDALVDRLGGDIDRRGFGFWALERRSDDAFLGFTGISVPPYDAPFMPAVEIGWRLARDAWGQGYATEAARAALAHGFDEVGLDEIVSFTATVNLRSIAVMERIGMTRDLDGDFAHPNVAPGHRLERHVLYRVAAS